ncbi:hypothetical protein [Streptomyces albus]|uniref:hypothetical protein n=1 Tax=Streptomyces albus TaxID=1888 RepID=UPI0004C95339|nr:hypothetical protein [Streptomyces albus]
MKRFSGENNRFLRMWLVASFLFALFLVFLMIFQGMHGAWVGLAVLSALCGTAIYVTGSPRSR